MKVLKELVEIYFFLASAVHPYGTRISVANLNTFYMSRGSFNRTTDRTLHFINLIINLARLT